MEKDALIKEVREYVARGETEKAIEMMLAQLSELDADLYQQILVLSGRFNKLKREQNLGLNPTENENEILHSIVEMIDDLKDKHAGVLREQPRPVRPADADAKAALASPSASPVRRNILIGLGALAVVIVGFILVQSLSGPGGGDSFAGQLDAAAVHFYLGSGCGEGTQFAEAFPYEEVRNINFCLELAYAPLEAEREIWVEAVYHMPDGFDAVDEDYHLLEAGSAFTYYTGKPLGSRETELPPGHYQVEVYIDDAFAAQGSFDVVVE